MCVFLRLWNGPERRRSDKRLPRRPGRRLLRKYSGWGGRRRVCGSGKDGNYGKYGNYGIVGKDGACGPDKDYAPDTHHPFFNDIPAYGGQGLAMTY